MEISGALDKNSIHPLVRVGKCLSTRTLAPPARVRVCLESGITTKKRPCYCQVNSSSWLCGRVICWVDGWGLPEEFAMRLVPEMAT